MKLLLLLFVAIGLLSASATAPQRTTRKKLKVEHRAETHRPPLSDTIAADTSTVRLSGYDKPLRSSSESLFCTNLSPRPITGVGLTIVYLDMSGRQLHSASHTVGCMIPPGETRILEFRSWDRRQSFYYRLSGKPRRSSGTPFEVSCRVDFVVSPIVPPEE